MRACPRVRRLGTGRRERLKEDCGVALALIVHHTQYDANICGAAASVGFCKDAVVAAVCAGTCKTNAKIDLCTVDHCDSTNSKFVNQT